MKFDRIKVYLIFNLIQFDFYLIFLWNLIELKFI